MSETADTTAILGPLWRYKWLILGVAIFVAVASYAYSRRERPVYTSMTEVYIGAGAEEQAPGEKATSKIQASTVTNQAAVINSIVVENVRARLRKEHKVALLHGTKIIAKTPEKSQFITITTQAHSGTASALLANITAQAYIRRAGTNHQRVYERTIAIARRQLRSVEAASAPAVAPKTGSSKRKAPVASAPSPSSILQAAGLRSKINQLESSLATTGAQQVKPAKAESAQMVSPKPRKSAIFGFVIGLVLAAIAAYILSRFDRRLRSLASIEVVFGAPILAALPKVASPVVRRDGTVRPSNQLLEPLRRLHTALELGDTNEESSTRSGRVILFISPDAGDGKSTLTADVALVQRDAGARVAVVEANFRRPVQARLLGLDGAHGLADVLEGRLSVEEASQRVMPPQISDVADPAAVGSVATAIGSRAGSLFVLSGGGAVPNPPALMAHETTAELLRSLAADYDYVLIDAPAPLEVSDVMPLIGLVGGVVIVARVGHTREASARRVVQLLDRAAGASVIGIVANCVARADARRYGFSSPTRRSWSGKRTR